MNWSEYFYYDESSPTWLRAAKTRWADGHILREVVRKDDPVGYVRKDGYSVVKLFGRMYKIHRIVWELHNPPLKREELIDHKDGNTRNNKIDNLRIATDYSNGKNKRKYKSNSSGVTGIHLNEKCPGKYYYVATWREVDKAIGAKSFSCSKLGKEEAFRQAVAYREAQMERLKLEGAPYTERHGK